MDRTAAASSKAGAVRPGTYAFFFLAFAALMLASHAGFLDFPYYWDEIGFYVPSAWDLQERGQWVPTSTTPNAHPPGLRAGLAAVWSVFGSSITVTRVAMLLVGALGLLLTFMLAIEVCAGLPGTPAFAAVMLLTVSPLFFMQSALAQPEVPALVCGVAATLAFLRGHFALSAMACVALVMCKETGVVFPLVFAWFARRQQRQAAWFALPLVALVGWFAFLWLRTGHLFGDAAFGEYNAVYNLHPARLAVALLRRLYTLGFENFHWVGLLAIGGAWLSWRPSAGGRPAPRLFTRAPWPLLATLTAGHLLIVSAFGGAVLERYLVPVLPFFYIAVAAAWTLTAPRARWMQQTVLAGGLVLGLWWNPPYPFPLENNLAARDQTMLFRQAAGLLDALPGDRIAATAWPLSAALRDPRFGYAARRHVVHEVADFRPGIVKQARIRPFDIFILYTREWDPPMNWLRVGWVERAWRWIYGYQPQMSAEEVSAWMGVPASVTYEQRGQRLDIFLARRPVQ